MPRIVCTTGFVCRGLCIAGLVLLLCFAAATLADGLLRSFYGRPIDLVRDIGGVVAAVSITLSFPYAFFCQSNIAIEAITKALNPGLDRLLQFVTAGIVQVVVLLFAIQFFRHAGNIARAGEVSVALNVPLAPFWYAVAVNLGLTLAAQTVLAIELGLAFVLGRESACHPANASILSSADRKVEGS